MLSIVAQMLAPDAYYQDFWNYAGWYGEEAARQTYGAYAPPVGSQPQEMRPGKSPPWLTGTVPDSGQA